MAQQPSDKNAIVRVMQIIAGALIAGVAAFGVYAAAQGLAEPPDPERTPFLAYMGAVMTFGMITAALFVPAAIARAGQKPPEARREPSRGAAADDPDLRYYSTYQTMMIVRLALLEGAAFLNLVALLQEHHWWSLALTGLLLLVMLASFPTSSRVEMFARQQREMAELEASRR
jgi:amino acid transporter